MPRIDVVVETPLSNSPRAKQVQGMFDVPPQKTCRLEWKADIEFPAEWNVGLIVGPSGCGKSTIGRQLFGENFEPSLAWKGASVIDDFPASVKMQQVAEACQAVGFNTIPAWLRPFRVLSNGERFRVDLARRLLSLPDPIVIDEFTSVVDRRVAKIGAHAVQKYARSNKRRFVAVTCHYDVIEWLQPDWIFEPATMAYTPRRSLQRRPPIDIAIGRIPHSAWRLFAPFHYMSADLRAGAVCFGLWADGALAAFGAVLPKPVSGGLRRGEAIAGVSRLVTLPDWQGLGLAFVLLERMGSAYKAVGRRLRTYPAHPGFVRVFDRSALWRLEKRPGLHSPKSTSGEWGGRPCAVFEYTGPAMPLNDARRLLAG